MHAYNNMKRCKSVMLQIIRFLLLVLFTQNVNQGLILDKNRAQIIFHLQLVIMSLRFYT